MGELRWSDELLDRMRGETDPTADAVAAAIVSRGTRAERGTNALFDMLAGNAVPLPSAMPEPMRRYFEETAQLPSWADPALVRRGEQLFMLHGPSMVTVLLLSSLPQCYACAKGAEVLARTGRLIDDFRRRIVLTAAFLMDVMQPGGLGPGGEGIRSTQKVRLVHASIRQFLAQSGGWDAKALGQPVNQEDLAGTLMSFSHVVLEGLPHLGVEISQDDTEAYIHCWKIVGHVLGIRDELQPADAADAAALWQAIARRQTAPSKAGTDLTAALLKFVHEALPGTIFDGVADVTSRALIGDAVSDLLGVPVHPVERVLLRPLRFFERLVDVAVQDVPFLHKLAPHLNGKLIVGLEHAWAGGDQIRFEIPPSLRGSWNAGPAPGVAPA